MGCNRCEKLPEIHFGTSDVYLSLPTHHHVESFESALELHNYNYKTIESGYLIHNTLFEPFIYFLSNSIFNSVEQKDVKILRLQVGELLSFASLANYKSLSEWLILFDGKAVSEIIAESRIKTLFQPIIDAQTNKIYGYEALSRGLLKDGTVMNPEVLFAQAKSMDLLFFLDRVCRESSIRAASQHGIKNKVFINFIPTAIYEPSLCLQSTEKVLHEVNLDSEQVVFEVVETEQVEDFEHLNRILDYYKNKGYSTALDDIGSGFSNVETLLQLTPDYMKIDMDIIRNIHLDLDNQQQLDSYLYYGKKLGLKILAEGVETLEEYRYLKAKSIDLMQGYLFGKPQEVPCQSILLPQD